MSSPILNQVQDRLDAGSRNMKLKNIPPIKNILLIVYLLYFSFLLYLLKPVQEDFNIFISNIIGIPILYATLNLLYVTYIKNKGFTKTREEVVKLNVKFINEYTSKYLINDLHDSVLFAVLSSFYFSMNDSNNASGIVVLFFLFAIIGIYYKNKKVKKV